MMMMRWSRMGGMVILWIWIDWSFFSRVRWRLFDFVRHGEKVRLRVMITACT